MAEPHATGYDPTDHRRCRLLAALLILGSALLHLLYLAHNCPLDLAPDEAHYWDWSRNLDWSYYSKGPLVAWLIRGSCLLFGSLSMELTGTQMLAVRLPAVLCGTLLLVSLYILTVQVFGRERLALAVVGCALTLPIMAAGSSLMTIDAPYTCCWGWALVLGHHAIVGNRRWAWVAAGVVVGLGILAKYTMVLWLPSLGLFLLANAAQRRRLLQLDFWLLCGIAGLCCLPILLWNVQNDWVTFRHVGGQAGLAKGQTGLLWLGPLIYVGTQTALYLVFWFAAWLAAMWVYRPGRNGAIGVSYLWWMSAPMFGVFLAFSLKTREEPNWPVTAYLSGLILAAAWLGDQLQDQRLWYRRLTQVSLSVACSLGLAMTLFVHRSELLYPPLARLAGAPTERQPLPLRRFDPTCRLRGWRVLAAGVDSVRAEQQAAGREVVLAASSWTLPGELGFYCSGHPVVYSLGLVQGDRHSQYDLWRPNPVADSARFLGQTFIFVGDLGPVVAQAFERIETPRTIIHYERGQPLARWQITVCHGFRGFDSGLLPTTQRRF